MVLELLSIYIQLTNNVITVRGSLRTYSNIKTFIMCHIQTRARYWAVRVLVEAVLVTLSSSAKLTTTVHLGKTRNLIFQC